MSETKRPVYQNIFEYMVDHYEFKTPKTVLTEFYKKDIYEYQYQNLDGPINDKKRKFRFEQEAAELISEFAWSAGASLVGFTHVKDHFVFQDFEPDPVQKYAVVLAYDMDYDLVNTAPNPPSGIEVLRAYWRLGHLVVKTAEFIRYLGYSALAHHPRSFVGQPPTILHTSAAYEAGLGEVGRMGVLITEEFGPRVRLATVTTELPLPQNNKKEFGVEKYCKGCSVCRNVCEGNAMPDELAEVNGFYKYTIDPYKCLPYFAEYDGCNLCVAKCPFNRKGSDLEQFIDRLKQ